MSFSTQNSIKLLEKFINSTPRKEIEEIVNRFTNQNVDSPTYSEYVELFDCFDYESIINMGMKPAKNTGLFGFVLPAHFQLLWDK